MNDLRRNLYELLDYINSAPAHRFLPYVAQSIDAMINELNNTNTISKQLEGLASGLGMFISDDFEFSKSETGKKILKVVNSILKSE